MLALAAYFALIAAFLSIQADFSNKSTEKTTLFGAQTEARAACLLLDFFSSNGKNTAMAMPGNENLTAYYGEVSAAKQVNGKALLGNATCLAEVSGAGALYVKEKQRDFS